MFFSISPDLLVTRVEYGNKDVESNECIDDDESRQEQAIEVPCNGVGVSNSSQGHENLVPIQQGQ